MAQVSKDGWTTYGPPEEQILAGQIAAAVEAAVHDCRLFARLARKARLEDLPSRLGLTWEQFCKEQLRQPSEVVEAIVRGVEILGEEIPIPAKVAARLGAREIGIKDGKAGPGRGNKTVGRSNRFNGSGRDYWVARLERDHHDDLVAQVRSGAVKAKTAARQAGIVKTKTPLEQLEHWWKKATADERQTFLRFLRETPVDWR